MSAILALDDVAAFQIAVSAGMLGWPSYLVVGVPVMYLAVRRAGARVGVFLVGGLGGNLGAPLVMTMQFMAMGEPFSPELVTMALHACWTFGFVFAALWSLGAGLPYRLLDRALPQ